MCISLKNPVFAVLHSGSIFFSTVLITYTTGESVDLYSMSMQLMSSGLTLSSAKILVIFNFNNFTDSSIEQLKNYLRNNSVKIRN